MGWAGGTQVCIDVWNAVRKYIPENKRVQALEKVVEALRDADWDCMYEIEDVWPEGREVVAKYEEFD